MHLTIEFGGGLELLCESVKVHNVDVNQKAGEEKLTMRDLLSWIHTNLIKERPEMFMKGDTVRPGVLVLVNDCDWELLGQLDATLEEKDVIPRLYLDPIGMRKSLQYISRLLNCSERFIFSLENLLDDGASCLLEV